MKKETLYMDLLPYITVYKEQHRRTADMDLEIIRRFSEGKGTVQISMEVPCAEATIYRAVSRVRGFLIQQESPCFEAGIKNVAKKKKS